MSKPTRTIFRTSAVERYINGEQSVEKPTAIHEPRVTMLYIAIVGCICAGTLLVGLLLRATQP